MPPEERGGTTRRHPMLFGAGSIVYTHRRPEERRCRSRERSRAAPRPPVPPVGIWTADLASEERSSTWRPDPVVATTVPTTTSRPRTRSDPARSGPRGPSRAPRPPDGVGRPRGGTVLYLSQAIGRPVRDRQGEPIGKVADLIVAVGDQYPPFTGLVVPRTGADLPALASVDTMDLCGARLRTNTDRHREVSRQRPNETVEARPAG